MTSKNKVEQTVVLNTKGYDATLKKSSATSSIEAQKINKSFESIKSTYRGLLESVKKDSLGIGGSLKKLKDNATKGAAIGGLTLGVTALSESMKSAAKSSGEFDKTFNRLAQRFDFSKSKVQQLRAEYRKLAGETGVAGGDITGAANNLLASNGGKSTGGLKDIAEFSKLEEGLNANDVSRSVIDFLKGSGKDVSQGNINDVLQSALAMQRGGDFSLNESLKLSTSTDANALSRAGLSYKENAALLAGSSTVGQDRASTTSAIQALIKKSVEGFGKGSALQGMLGVDGGSLLSNGKFDVEKLRGASANFKKMGLNDQDSVELLKGSGLSEGEAEGLVSILKDFDKFHNGFQKTLNDQKTINKAFNESTKNMPDALKKLQEKIITGVDEIIHPLNDVGTKLLTGDFMGALKSSPDAIVGSAKGVANNPGMVLAGLGGTALLGGLLSKTGLMGGTGAGVAKGLALEQATGDKVQPVFVVNASEISGGGSLGDAAGVLGKGKLGSLKKIGGVLSKLGGLALGAGKVAGGVGLAAGAGYAVGTGIDHLQNKVQWKSDNGFEGNTAEQIIHGISTLIGTESSKKINQANKIFLEIDSKDNGFKVKPTRKDNAVDIKGV